MKVTISGLGILKEHFHNRIDTVEVEDSVTVGMLIEELEKVISKEFYGEIMQNNNISPYIVIMHNGISINAKDGLNTVLKDGDRLVFTVFVDGG